MFTPTYIVALLIAFLAISWPVFLDKTQSALFMWLYPIGTLLLLVLMIIIKEHKRSD